MKNIVDSLRRKRQGSYSKVLEISYIDSHTQMIIHCRMEKYCNPDISDGVLKKHARSTESQLLTSGRL